MIEKAFSGASIGRSCYRTLLVDLNSFATFPTLATGILIAALRKTGHNPTLLVPLVYDVPARERERREWWLDDVMRRVHLSTRPILHRSVAHCPTLAAAKTSSGAARSRQGAECETRHIELSAYLHHYPTIVQIGKLAADARVPMLLGGPALNLSGVAESWRAIPGLTAPYGGEADLIVPKLVEAIIAGENLLRFDGVMLPDGRHSSFAAPFRKLDLSPTPDFTDFPWDRYRVRIIPMMTGRGCQWGKCTFCSDVFSVNGRTYRTRSLDSVLHEMKEQARRYETGNFLFLDLN